MNNDERTQWINNDEGLYAKYQFWLRQNRGRGGLRTFIKENRDSIDTAIEHIRSGRKRPHYLRYGP